MTSISREEVYDIFSLAKDEKIIDDFNCFLVETFPILGKLYLAENHILFYSNIIFLNRSISIPINDSTKINLNDKIIEISSKTEDNLEKKYKFCSNDDIKNIYEKIKSSIPKSTSDSDNDSIEIFSRKTSASSELAFSKSSSKDNLSKNENEEINEEIKFIPIQSDVDFEICRKIINISPKDLFNKYYTNKFPETSYEKFYEWVGDHSNIKISEWEKIENIENLEKFQKTEKFSLSLHGLPLVDHSEVSKISTYYIDKDGTYYISASSKSEGIPFADSFTIETKIELHPYYKGNKTVFRTYVRTNFLKYIFLKNMLISQTKKTYNEEINKWLKFIVEKGETIEGDYVYKERTNNSPSDEKNNNIDETEKLINNNEKCKDYLVSNGENNEKLYNKFNKSIIIIIIALLLLILFYLLLLKLQRK